MEDFDVDDDDFGDLYADVEAQASSGINVVCVLAPSCNDNVVSGLTPLRHDNVVGGSKMNGSHSSDEEDEVDKIGSDSEDDLNIVLNDDESSKSRGYGVGKDENEDHFMAINECAKTRGSSSPSNTKANLSASVLATGCWNYQNLCGQFQGSTSGQGAVVGSTQNFGPSQRRYGFSLPSHRSILDVNIDTFEEKPWRYTGADITDFFNFGLDEDTWKQYCNDVDKFRLSMIMLVMNDNHVSENQVIEAGSNYVEHFEEPVIDNDCQPKGIAIRVEDGNGERLPTADIRRPYARDSDVVIQINLEDPIENTSDAGGRLDDHSGSTEPDNKSLSHHNGGVGDEVSLGSTEENNERVYRSSAKTTTSNPRIVDLDESGKKPCYDDGDENHRKNSFSSDETVIESVKKSSKCSVMNVSCASVVETELPLEEDEDEGQLSLTSSCFGSDSEASVDGSSQLDSRNVTSPVRRSPKRNSDAELCESDMSHQNNLNRKSAKIRPVDSGGFSKCRVRNDQKKRIWRVDVSGSAAEEIYQKDHLSVNSGSWRSLRDRKDIAYHEDSEHSYGCVGRELAKSRLHTASESYKRLSHGFHKERSSYLQDNWKNRRNICKDERSEGHVHRQGLNTGNIASEKYYSETHHRAYRYSYTHREEMDSQYNRRNDTLQFGTSVNHVTRCLDYKQADSDFILERYGRYGSIIEQTRDTSNRSYERSFLKPWKRSIDSRRRLEEEDSWYDSFRYPSHQIYRDSNLLLDDEYSENMDIRYFPSHSYKEYHGGRWTDQPMSPTDDVPNSRFIERETRLLSSWEGSDSYSYNNSSGFTDRVRFKRKGSCFRKLSIENPALFSKNNSRQKRAYSAREYHHDRMQTDDDTQSDKRGLKMYTSNANCRVRNEQAFMRCRDSVNLNLGEGKESGICHRERNSASFIDSPKTGHERFSTGQLTNKDLDIEEGQIIVAGEEEEEEERREKKRSCEFDNRRILESLAKMEKRRERFKEPITSALLKKDEKVDPDVVVAVSVDTPQSRPQRKRQWCAR